jgi:hypothetical protein
MYEIFVLALSFYIYIQMNDDKFGHIYKTHTSSIDDLIT